MITYEQLKRNPKAFKGFTGLSLTEFDELYELFEPAWLSAEEERLNRPDRRRSIGGGAQYSLELKTRLLMVMFWLRLYLTQETVGYFFNLHKSNVSRNGKRILQVLRQVSEDEFEWPDPPKRGHGRTAEQAFRDYPDLFAIVDATEQPIQRSKNDEKQRSHYSGKKKRHTRKTAIIVNELGLIRAISPSTPGSMHDIKHLRLSGLLEKIPKEVGVIGDSGFDGLHKDLPEHSVATAHKARRNHPVPCKYPSRTIDLPFRPFETGLKGRLAFFEMSKKAVLRASSTSNANEGLTYLSSHNSRSARTISSGNPTAYLFHSPTPAQTDAITGLFGTL